MVKPRKDGQCGDTFSDVIQRIAPAHSVLLGKKILAAIDLIILILIDSLLDEQNTVWVNALNIV